MNSTYVYRLLKSSWGILISITAQADFKAELTGQIVSPGIPVGLVFSGRAANIPRPDKEEIARGLGLIAREISLKVNDGPVIVNVSDVSYMESDFQLEGLSVAICRWAERELGLDYHDIVETFDRASNRYSFDWRWHE